MPFSPPPTTTSATCKPFAVSEAFLAEWAYRLRQVFPDAEGTADNDPVPPSLRDFEVIVADGKAVERVPHRLKPARQRKGGLLVGKGLAALRQRLHELLGSVWSDLWIKSVSKKRKPPAAKKGKRDHTSVYRLLNAHRQSGSKATVT